jgi:hypothetical protein
MRSDIVPEGAFPDYELLDHTSTPRKLSELQGDEPLILTLARGHCCPKEHHVPDIPIQCGMATFWTSTDLSALLAFRFR